MLSSHFVPRFAFSARLTQIFSGSEPLQPRKVLVSNPDSHSPRYSRVESGVAAAARGWAWLLGEEGCRGGVGCGEERAHAARSTIAAVRTTRLIAPDR